MQHGLTNPAVSLHQPAPVIMVVEPSASFSQCWVIILLSTPILVPTICPKTCSWSILEHTEGGREWERELQRCKRHCWVDRKWPYCFQGHLAFPFRATRGLFAPFKPYVSNKQNSLSHKLYLVWFPPPWAGLRKGITLDKQSEAWRLAGTLLHSTNKGKSQTKQISNHIIWLLLWICDESWFNWFHVSLGCILVVIANMKYCS